MLDKIYSCKKERERFATRWRWRWHVTRKKEVEEEKGALGQDHSRLQAQS